jgi:hypothetical protein
LTLLAILTCLGVASRTAYAREDDPAPIDAATAKALLQRVQDLEAEVQALKSQMRTLAAGQATDGVAASGMGTPAEKPAVVLTSAAPAPATPASPAKPASMPDMQAATDQSSVPGHAIELNGPRLTLRGFGDVGWRNSDLPGSTNSFYLGQLNLFITSRLTDRASFLVENVIEADPVTNQFGIEPERLMLIYSVNDHLQLSIGRYHTAIGFYNTAYHHSALMQTTERRPFLFEFEDGGGILPIHNVGVSATGVVSSKLGLHYVAEIGNGRSARTVLGNSPVQNVTDEHNGKAFNLAFYVRPPRFSHLQFGASGYHDNLTPVVLVGGVPVNAPNVNEDIISGHVVYQTTGFELLNEALLLQHTAANSTHTVNIPGFYSQISHAFGRYRPYFRYEYVNVPVTDPLYSDVGLIHGPRTGIRYSLNESAAFKIEVGRDMRRNQPSVNLVGTQLSFAF